MIATEIFCNYANHDDDTQADYGTAVFIKCVDLPCLLRLDDDIVIDGMNVTVSDSMFDLDRNTSMLFIGIVCKAGEFNGWGNVAKWFADRDWEYDDCSGSAIEHFGVRGEDEEE